MASHVNMDAASSTPLMNNGVSIQRLHREGVVLPDMVRWGASKQDKAKLGEMFATGMMLYC